MPRGGKRDRAGRKPPDVLMERIHATIPKDSADYIRSLGNGSTSRGLMVLLERANYPMYLYQPDGTLTQVQRVKLEDLLKRVSQVQIDTAIKNIAQKQYEAYLDQEKAARLPSQAEIAMPDPPDDIEEINAAAAWSQVQALREDLNLPATGTLRVHLGEKPSEEEQRLRELVWRDINELQEGLKYSHIGESDECD